MIDSHHNETHAQHFQTSIVTSTATSHSLSLSALVHHKPFVLHDRVHASSHCSIQVIDTPLPRPLSLLCIATDVRSLIWQYMDNHSAVHYLGTCSQLHALYHSFPLTEPVSIYKLCHITDITRALRRSEDTPPLPGDCDLCWGLLILVFLPILLLLCMLVIVLGVLFPDRQHCCQQNSRLTRYMRVRRIPRVIRSADVCYGPALPFLQHAEELRVVDHRRTPINEYKLPRTLRRLYVALLADRNLDGNWLPPQLTALAIVGGTEDVIQPGMLPQSLLSLFLERAGDVYGSSAQNSPFQPIAAGVLPSQLQHLVIHWYRSLTNLALPASLTRLDLYELPDLPIPPDCLPVGLRTLRISTTMFDPRHLIGALPPRLCVLQLHCMLTQPLTAAMLSSAQLLEELDLGSLYPHLLTAGSLVPLTQLRVLRLPTMEWQPISVFALPVSLRRLILVIAAHGRPSVNELVPLAATRPALVVGFETQPADTTNLLSALAMFNEMCTARP